MRIIFNSKWGRKTHQNTDNQSQAKIQSVMMFGETRQFLYRLQSDHIKS